jgi:hypothetical protein
MESFKLGGGTVLLSIRKFCAEVLELMLDYLVHESWF